MKLLARGESSPSEVVDVNATLEESIAFASSTIRYQGRVEPTYAELAGIHGNGSQLAQVFVNLLTNAAHAVSQRRPGRGVIRVRTFMDAGNVVVEVADDGCGIPEELQGRIFDPFFTTKEVGAGMGLGLSICHTIVKAMGGEITFTSSVDVGSVFRVALPAVSRPIPRPTTRLAPATERSESDASQPLPTILVVDDEPAVAKLLGQILAKEANVVAETSSVKALELLGGREASSFALILCDLMMPEMNGSELYEQVTARRPELGRRFAFMTGGAFTSDGRRFLSKADVPVIDKPFDIKDVRDFVRSQLELMRAMDALPSEAER